MSTASACQFDMQGKKCRKVFHGKHAAAFLRPKWPSTPVAPPHALKFCRSLRRRHAPHFQREARPIVEAALIIDATKRDGRTAQHVRHLRRYGESARQNINDGSSRRCRKHAQRLFLHALRRRRRARDISSRRHDSRRRRRAPAAHAPMIRIVISYARHRQIF